MMNRSERKLETLVGGGAFFESPRWHDGRLWVSDYWRYQVLAISPDGTTDTAAELTELKRRPGKNIQIPGSPTLVRWLLRNGLLDELALMVCPVVVGSGMRLFDELTDQIEFELVASTPLSTGALAVTYQPASAAGESLSFPDAAARRT